jgi:hypothetical protein
MYENLMDEVVTEENRMRALEAVTRNRGAAGIDRMTTKELEKHLQAHWEKIRAKLLAGSYVPSPVRRVEIPKPSGGKRMLGIPTVQDRLIQQMLLQALTPILEPGFSEQSYGFRPGRKAQDAVQAAQKQPPFRRLLSRATLWFSTKPKLCDRRFPGQIVAPPKFERDPVKARTANGSTGLHSRTPCMFLTIRKLVRTGPRRSE